MRFGERRGLGKSTETEACSLRIAAIAGENNNPYKQPNKSIFFAILGSGREAISGPGEFIFCCDYTCNTGKKRERENLFLDSKPPQPQQCPTHSSFQSTSLLPKHATSTVPSRYSSPQPSLINLQANLDNKQNSRPHFRRLSGFRSRRCQDQSGRKGERKEF